MKKQQRSAGRHSWMVFFICTAIYIFTFLYRMAPSSMALYIYADMGFGVSEMSVIGSATILGFGIMQLPCGLLTDRFGGKVTLLMLTLLAGVSTIWFSMAHSFGSVAVSRLLTGLGVSATIPCVSILARQFRSGLFARVCSAMYGCGALGTIAAAAPLAWASAAFGWRGSMLVCGLSSLLLAVLLFLIVRQSADRDPSETESRRRPMLSCIKSVLASRHFWLLCTVYSGLMIAFLGFYGLWFGPYLVQACGLGKVEAGTILSAGAAAGVAGMPIAALISDAIRSRKAVIITMTGVQALCIAALAFFPGRLPVPALAALAASFAFFDGAAGLCFTSCK
jgi:predicted MFS family arabinose efflux permease